MSAIAPGELRHRLALQTPVVTDDGGGGLIRSWSLVAEVWGALRPLSGGEGVAADAIAGRVNHEVWIRYRPGVVPEMRFALGTRVFDIRSVIDVGERHRFLRCLVEETVP